MALPRWSTPAVLVITVGVAALAWLAGRNSRERASAVMPETLSAPAPVRGAPAEPPHPAPARDIELITGLFAQPPSATRDEQLARAFEAWARREPAAAFARARAESQRVRRALWRDAALRGWAGHAPDEAARAALALSVDEREAALAAVFAGTAHQPELACALASRLVAAEPGFAPSRGRALISALTQTGEFSAAATFAGQAGELATRDGWLAAAFARWGENEPVGAAAAARALSDPAQRAEAVRAVVGGWAQTAPETLAPYAINLPAGEERTYALGEALRQWVEQDAVTAAGWLDHFDPTPDLDEAVAAIATRPFLAAQHPDVAVSWAESITDARLRGHTLAAIVREWATTDRAAATRYVAAAPDLAPDERADLLNGLGSP